MTRRYMLTLILLFILGILIAGIFLMNPWHRITSFEECEGQGNPIMESYPRQCRADGKVFIEKLKEPQKVSPKFTEDQAKKIAEQSCIKGGEAVSAGSYNENTRTWWFDANLNAIKAGCKPACVVFEDTEQAEVNWRCTGLAE